MRSGIAAALVLSILLACPALAEGGISASAPAAAAAAAAAQAARSNPLKAPAPEAAAPPADKQATAPPAAGADETPAEPGSTPDAPPAQAVAAPALDEKSAPQPTQPAALVSPPATEAKTTPQPATDDSAPPADPPAAAPAETAAVPPTPAAPPAAGTPNAKPKLIAAKTLFGAVKDPAPLASRSIGAYSRGCLSGAKPLAVDGPAWQAMRLSRNRTWGHPDLIALLERYAGEVKQDGWPGLLVGDISQPRGGPMLTGHASHQVGLDADIWFTPMPDHRLTNKERETLAATSMLADDSLSVDPKVWSESRVKIIKRIASYSKVERVLVHPAIKKALCAAAGTDRKWLNKVRPYWGHFYHFHVRIGCPAGSAGCKPQAPIPGDDGCGKELDDWFKLLTRKPKPKPVGEPRIVAKPSPPARPVTLDDLPGECRTVLATGTDLKLPPPAVASTAGHKAKAAAAKPAAKSAVAKSADKKAGPTKAAAAKTVEKTKKE